MKKFLIAFLATLVCLLTVAALGCNDNCNNEGEPLKEYTVVFTPTENLEYICEDLEEGETTLTVKSGSVVSFSVKVPVFYAVPTVYANNYPVTAQKGVYSVTVTGDVTIKTAEVREDSVSVTNSGTGTSESPFLISSPKDYLFVADRINEGNSYYVSSYYELENDIDFGGTEIPVIGDGVYSYFMGNFNGKGYTISNFKIHTNGITNVGLFGYVVSSGNNDGSGMLVNIKIDNFEIEAQAASGGAMYVGSLLGYGIASTVIACSATNGSIVVHADTSVFSYVGGAIGVQNSAILTNGNSIQYYPASTSYVYTNVDIDCNGGVLAAGGITGFVVSEHERAIASVVNCHSEGNVFGGIYSGGVAGYLSDYSSIANSYSLSEIYAYARYQDNEVYSHAYAGGIVGYIGNNAIVTDSFANNIVDGASISGASYVHKGEQFGGKAAATVIADEGILFNCKSGNDVKTTVDFFKNTLHWQDCDWIITAGSYPVINMEESQPNRFTVTFVYNIDNDNRKVDGKTSRELTVYLSDDFYSPMYYFFNEDKNVSGEEYGDIVLSDDGETSYGYFFDSDLTQKVPYGFVPTRNITLYTGFTDYNEVAGTYYLISRNSQREITLVLNTNGAYTYNDGVIYNEDVDGFNDFYTYNGTKLIFSNGLFARLSDSVTVNGDDNNSVARPDLNYNLTKFAAIKAEGGLEIFDGSFFTEADPLKANRYAISGEWHYNSEKYVFYTNNTGTFNGQSFKYSLTSSGELTITYGETIKTGTVNGGTVIIEGNTLSKYDVFKGVWEIASNINRKYEFDGIENWTYTVKGVVKSSGTYQIGGDGVATLKSGLTAQIDASGLLLVKNNDDSEYFAKESSFSGIWVDLENNIVIYINGFGSSLAGGALISMGGTTYELAYILDGFFDGDGNTHLTLLNGYALFGYLTCHEEDGMVVSFTGTFFSSNTGAYLSGYNFYLLDTLEGDWVGEGTLDGVQIDSLHFNGLGFHENGSVLLNGSDEMGYTLNENFDGIFGAGYSVAFDDELNIITLSKGNEEVTLYRKDKISSYVLISNSGIKFVFNGGGNLSKGGKLTLTDSKGNEIAVLGYKISGTIDEPENFVITIYSKYRGGDEVGAITIKDNKFVFEYNGESSWLPADENENSDGNKFVLTLTIDNPFSGTWSVSGFSTIIVIGTLDLSNKIKGQFLDMEHEVEFTYYPDYECLMVPYITEGMTSAAALYLIMLNESNMVISSYNVITAGDNLIYCAPQDTLYGTWYDAAKDSQKLLRFDGMSNSLYSVGIVWDESGEVYYYTRRFGTYYFWSSDGESAYTIVKTSDTEGASMVYYQTARNRIAFYEFDLSSCILEVKDGDTTYKFYLTHVEVDGVEKDYTLVSVKGNVTELIIYEDEEHEDGVRFSVNYADKTIETID